MEEGRQKQGTPIYLFLRVLCDSVAKFLRAAWISV